MARKNEENLDDSVELIGPEYLDQLDPKPGEDMMKYWQRINALGASVMMKRAFMGDKQATATMYRMLEAPVLQEVTMTQINAKGGNMKQVKGTVRGLDDLQMALISGENRGPGL